MAGSSTPTRGRWPAVRVVLHRVGRQTQGPVDSTTSARDGRFRFRFTSDTSSLYLLSARYAGVEYFSPPLQVGRGRPDTTVSLLVYDTSSTAPIELAARHLVIPRPGDDGTREVLDLVVLQNQGTLARVAPDTLGASWSAPLPPGSEGLDVGEGDVSPDAMARRGDSVFMAAPIGPGEKQLSFQYHLPRGRTAIQIPFGREGGPVNVLLEEPGATVAAPRMTLADTQLIGGRSFRRYTGAVPAGAVDLREAAGTSADPDADTDRAGRRGRSGPGARSLVPAETTSLWGATTCRGRAGGGPARPARRPRRPVSRPGGGRRSR